MESGIINSSQFQFNWNEERTVLQNFTEWYILNSEERSAYCEPILEKDEAIKEIANTNPKLVIFVLYGQNPNSGTTMMIGACELAEHLKKNYSNLINITILTKRCCFKINYRKDRK